MLARLPWGRRDVLGSMNEKYEGVSVKYASLIVSSNKFVKHIQLHMIMIYTGALPGQGPQA